MNGITIIGIVASICTALSLLPQLIKLAREKKAENISIGMIAILLAGLILWIWYGICKKDLIIIISNSTSMIINIALTVLTIKYKQRNSS